MKRAYETTRTTVAGCRNCTGSTRRWSGHNAQGVAARHHDATGHQTWVEVTLSIVYGRASTKTVDPQQLSLPTPPPAPSGKRRPGGKTR